MKRLAAFLLVLVLALSLAACNGEPSPTTQPTTESTAAPTTEPATKPTTVPTTESTTEPATEPAETESPARQAGLRLTAEELAQYEMLLHPDSTPYASHPVNYYAMALCVDFDAPENLNLMYYFCQGFYLETNDPITDEELDFFIRESGYDKNTMGDLYRLPANRVNGILEYYFCVTAEQVTGWSDQGWVYHPGTDCYYLSPSGALLPGTVTFHDGYYDEATGTVSLYYRNKLVGQEYVVTLQSKLSVSEMGYHILSNLPVA